MRSNDDLRICGLVHNVAKIGSIPAIIDNYKLAIVHSIATIKQCYFFEFEYNPDFVTYSSHCIS